MNNQSKFTSGVRKRMNIALELSGGGMLLFLDEPTSSLSSTQSLELIRLLNYFSLKLGMTTLLIIHQPRIEIFELLEFIVYLGPGGQLIYSGPQRWIKEYFDLILNLRMENEDDNEENNEEKEMKNNNNNNNKGYSGINPADFYMDCIALNGNEMAEKWLAKGKSWVEQKMKNENSTTMNNNNQNNNNNSTISSSISPQSPISFEIPSEYSTNGFWFQLYSSFQRSFISQIRLPIPILFELFICLGSGFF